MTAPWRGRAIRRPDQPQATPWEILSEQAQDLLAAQLAQASQQGLLSDVDHVRIAGALRAAVGDQAATQEVVAALRADGPAAFCHSSGQRDLDVRLCRHLLAERMVRLGAATRDLRNSAPLRGADFGLDVEMLRTSLLAIGPPGSGKTRGFAVPIVEHLCLQSLAQQASVVVIDPKGDDFAFDGWFDVDIDLANPASAIGFDLYGGAADPEQATDRLASALLPPGVSADKTYFMDAAKNALYAAIAPFHAAFGRYPRVREALDMLAGQGSVSQAVRARLKNAGRLAEFGHLLDGRLAQRGRRDDPASGLVERLGLLNRPTLVELLDDKGANATFRMSDINSPLRVRFALPEGMFPEAARILARLAVAQFVQVASSPLASTGIFRCLVIDEAGRYIDDYVAHGTQRIRSKNAGLVLLTQSLGDFPVELLDTIFSSTGCKAVFAGINPRDAEYFADYFGKQWVEELTLSRNAGTSRSSGQTGRSSSRSPAGYSSTRHGQQRSETRSQQSGAAVRQVERYLWSPSEIINEIPAGHALVSLARPDGVRVPATLVNLRA